MSQYRVQIGSVVEVVEAMDETDAVAAVRSKHACDERLSPDVRLATEEDLATPVQSEGDDGSGGSDV